jgi:hypothetical protein
MSGGGGTTQNTVTSSTQIPAYEQQFSQDIQNNAQNLAAQPYPTYQAPLEATLNPQENQAFSDVNAAQTVQDPYNTQAMNQYSVANNNLGTSVGMQAQDAAMQQWDAAVQGTSLGYQATDSSMQGQDAGMQNQDAAYQAQGAGYTQEGNQELNYANTLNPGNGAALSQYMSPYVQQALSPQILQMETQLGQQQNATAAQATSAGAFGDARQGVSNALNNYYGDQTLAGIESTGYNTAYTNALSSLNQQQQNVTSIGQGMNTEGATMGQYGSNVGQAGSAVGQAGSAVGQAGSNVSQAGSAIGTAGAQTGQAGVNDTNNAAGYASVGNDISTLGNTAQQEALTGANAEYDAGDIQQNQTQEGLNLAYQQYQNQVQWPYQMENVEESALSNSPYTIANQVTLPSATSASSLGAFAQTAGSLGSLLSGSSTTSSGNGSTTATPGPV